MSYHNNIQFTELTPDDIATHEDLYIDLLVNSNNSDNVTLSKKYFDVYYKYAIGEVQKSKSLFQKTFGKTFE